MARLKMAGRKPIPKYKQEPALDEVAEEEMEDSMEEEEEEEEEDPEETLEEESTSEEEEGDEEDPEENLENETERDNSHREILDSGPRDNPKDMDSHRGDVANPHAESVLNAKGKEILVENDPPLIETKEEQVHLEPPSKDIKPNQDMDRTIATENKPVQSLEQAADFSQVQETGKCEAESDVNLEADQNKVDGNKEVEDTSIVGEEKQKINEVEIKIQGLDTGTVEGDLIEVFKKFGEVQDVRMAEKKHSGKCKGFAFLQYAAQEQAMNVLHELKDGIEVRGRCVKLSASQKSRTVLIGNISKLWKTEHVVKQLKVYEIEQFKDVQIPDDPENVGRNLGFALLEFSDQRHADDAVQRLKSPDVFFGCERSALVHMCTKAEAQSQVKTVYVKGLTKSWDEDKLKEICKQYGDIKDVRMARNFRKMRKPFAFVDFASWESALACVNGINKSQFGEGKNKVEAELAKPSSNSQLYKNEREKQNNSKFKGDEEQNQRKERTGNSKIKANDSHGNVGAQEMGRAHSGFRGGKQKQHEDANSTKKRPKREKKSRRLKDGGKQNLEGNHKDKQSKTDGGKAQHRQRKRNFGRKHQIKELSHPRSLPGTLSGSKRHYFDMEPHAGYLERGTEKQTRYYLDPRQGHQVESQSSYSRHASWSQGLASAVNLGSTLGTQGLPHVGLLDPGIGNQAYTVYDRRQMSAGGYVGQGNVVSAYAAGSAVPRTYDQAYATRVGHPGHATTGSYQLNYGAYLPHGKLY